MPFQQQTASPDIKKARVLTRKLYEYFKVSDKDKVRKFRELCEILKDHCGPASLPTQMMDEVLLKLLLM